MTNPETNKSSDQGSAQLRLLRGGTDELELIISGLTIFALVSIPGWLFERFAAVYTHLSTSVIIAGNLGITLVAGICYGLAACFVVHLMARSYWVGLIGLRTVFPDGINWDRTPGIGPLSREYYREKLPDLDTVIEKSDRLASSLFAVISMLTLSVLWFGTILISILVLSAFIGARSGQTNAAMGIGTIVLVSIFFGAPVLAYLLDAQLAARIPRLRESRSYVAVVRFLKRLAGLAFPQRLVLPVQLTLQSNTRPIIYLVALLVGIMVILAVGNARSAAWRNFTISSAFDYLETEQVREGMRSTHYEDMPASLDRLRGWPRVDSFNQSGSFVRLFLPYQPLRDNLILDDLCGSADEAPNRIDCLRKLWAIDIDGIPVSLDEFGPAERADLNMRGLIGLVPLEGLEPGLRTITVVWNPLADEDAPRDDRYTQASFSYSIPIAFSPTYERQLP